MINIVKNYKEIINYFKASLKELKDLDNIVIDVKKDTNK